MTSVKRQSIRLTATSYIVLGLLAECDEATPYELKALCAESIGNLWSLQHTQLYAEPDRLAGAGYLSETQEEGGRRRKLYRITEAGRAALEDWLASGPTDELPEIRDINLLKVFFGADPVPIAVRQAQAHRAKLREYTEVQRTHDLSGAPGKAIALRAGLRYEQQFIRFWESLAGEADGAGGVDRADEAGKADRADGTRGHDAPAVPGENAGPAETSENAG